MMISIPHPGHPLHAVHPDHPGYPVPVIQSVLQGRVYHRFGIFVLLFIVGVFLYARNRGPPPECLLGRMTGGVIQRRSHDIIRLATA